MGISIKNDEVETLIRDLADKTGASVTEAVKLAVFEKLELIKLATKKQEEYRRQKIGELIERMRELPVYDARDHGEMLYDQDGMPK